MISKSDLERLYKWSQKTIFPFKKENWKMKVAEKTGYDHTITFFRYGSKLRKWYEEKLWKKIKWS